MMWRRLIGWERLRDLRQAALEVRHIVNTAECSVLTLLLAGSVVLRGMLSPWLLLWELSRVLSTFGGRSPVWFLEEGHL